MKKDKNNLNKLHQVKNAIYTSTHNVKYSYRNISHDELGKKVLELRKQYPNNQEFGNAIEKFLLSNKGCPTFPGIQKL
jgi:hypothetical protein